MILNANFIRERNSFPFGRLINQSYPLLYLVIIHKKIKIGLGEEIENTNFFKIFFCFMCIIYIHESAEKFLEFKFFSRKFPQK